MNYPSLLTPNDTEFLRVDEQQIILPKCQINFNKWKGVTIAHTFGGKPLIDVEGIPMFAEMAILKLFEKSGWETRWIETYARPKSSPIYLNEWKDDEFKNQIHVPIENEKINELISRSLGRTGMVWRKYFIHRIKKIKERSNKKFANRLASSGIKSWTKARKFYDRTMGFCIIVA